MLHVWVLALWVQQPLFALQRATCTRMGSPPRRLPACLASALPGMAQFEGRAPNCQPAVLLCADGMLIWGWRIPFLLAFLTALLGAQREGGGAEDNGRGRSCIHVRHVVPMPLGKTQQHAAHA